MAAPQPNIKPWLQFDGTEFPVDSMPAHDNLWIKLINGVIVINEKYLDVQNWEEQFKESAFPKNGFLVPDQQAECHPLVSYNYKANGDIITNPDSPTYKKDMRARTAPRHGDAAPLPDGVTIEDCWYIIPSVGGVNKTSFRPSPPKFRNFLGCSSCYSIIILLTALSMLKFFFAGSPTLTKTLVKDIDERLKTLFNLNVELSILYILRNPIADNVEDAAEALEQPDSGKVLDVKGLCMVLNGTKRKKNDFILGTATAGNSFFDERGRFKFISSWYRDDVKALITSDYTTILEYFFNRKLTLDGLTECALDPNAGTALIPVCVNNKNASSGWHVQFPLVDYGSLFKLKATVLAYFTNSQGTLANSLIAIELHRAAFAGDPALGFHAGWLISADHERRHYSDVHKSCRVLAEVVKAVRIHGSSASLKRKYVSEMRKVNNLEVAVPALFTACSSKAACEALAANFGLSRGAIDIAASPELRNNETWSGSSTATTMKKKAFGDKIAARLRAAVEAVGDDE
jgi:hypothetical protein